MKITRPLAATASALALVTGVASFTLLGGGDAVAAGKPSSAFGLNLSIAGNNAIERLPEVVSTDGKLVEESLIPLNVNPLIGGGVANASAKNGNAKASVTDLGVGKGLLAQLPEPLLTNLGTTCNTITGLIDPVTGALNGVLGTLVPTLGDLLDQISNATDGSPLDLGLLGALDLSKLENLQLSGLCDVLTGKNGLVGAGTIIAECNGQTGTVQVTDLTALGVPVDIAIDQPNKEVSVQGLLTITGNRQTKNADGTFTVDALNVNLLGQIDLTIASATCGEVTTSGPGDEAPVPTPVETNVPVTG